MAKKRKTKKKKLEREIYEIEVIDWDAAYHFGLSTFPAGLIEGVYWEHSGMILTGKILSPVLEKASKARIEIAAEPKWDDHWKANPTTVSVKAIGWMIIPRGDDTLIFYVSVPSQSLPYLALAVDSRKIKFFTIFGTKLKWRRGTISNISLSSHREE